MKNDWETIALRKKSNAPSSTTLPYKKFGLKKNLEFTRLCMQNIYHDFSTF